MWPSLKKNASLRVLPFQTMKLGVGNSDWKIRSTCCWSLLEAKRFCSVFSAHLGALQTEFPCLTKSNLSVECLNTSEAFYRIISEEPLISIGWWASNALRWLKAVTFWYPLFSLSLDELPFYSLSITLLFFKMLNKTCCGKIVVIIFVITEIMVRITKFAKETFNFVGFLMANNNCLGAWAQRNNFSKILLTVTFHSPFSSVVFKLYIHIFTVKLLTRCTFIRARILNEQQKYATWVATLLENE